MVTDPFPTAWHMGDTSWMERAACRGCNPRIFEDPRRFEQALAICRTCPPDVVDKCRKLPMTHLGVWGGRIHREDSGGSQAADDCGSVILLRGYTIRHGTETGYNQHRRLRVPMCEDCRAAHNAARWQRKLLRRNNR